MIFVETTVFTRRLSKILTDGEYRELQEDLIKDPELGSVIKGSGGIRKVRWSSKGHGKRGGCRVIYFWFKVQEQIHLLLIYGKNEQADLTTDQLKVVNKLIEEEHEGGLR